MNCWAHIILWITKLVCDLWVEKQRNYGYVASISAMIDGRANPREKWLFDTSFIAPEQQDKESRRSFICSQLLLRSLSGGMRPEDRENACILCETRRIGADEFDDARERRGKNEEKRQKCCSEWTVTCVSAFIVPYNAEFTGRDR